MFGIYTIVRKLLIKNTVNLQRGEFLKTRNNRWSLEGIQWWQKIKIHKKGNILRVWQCQMKPIEKPWEMFGSKQTRTFFWNWTEKVT